MHSKLRLINYFDHWKFVDSYRYYFTRRSSRMQSKGVLSSEPVVLRIADVS